MEIAIYALYGILAAFIFFGPRPEPPKAATLEDFDLPTAEEGRTLTVVVGTREISAPNVVWYGDLKVQAIKKRSMFSSTVVGYKYYLGVHMILCHSGIDQLQKIKVGEDLVWEADENGVVIYGAATKTSSILEFIEGSKVFNQDTRQFELPAGFMEDYLNTLGYDTLEEALIAEREAAVKDSAFGKKPIYIDAPEVHGQEGGIVGYIDVEFGLRDQGKNSYLAEQLGEDAIPNYRGVVGVVLNQVYVGKSAYPKPWAFVIRAVEKDTFGRDLWYLEKAAIGPWDANPVHIIYQALTNPNWGLGMDEAELDQENFRAVADYFYEEKFGLSFIVNVENDIEDFIADVLRHINAALRLSFETGLFQIKLIRDDYTYAELELFDESKISAVEDYQRTVLADLVNTITLSYWDRDLEEVSTFTLQDLAAVSIQGGIIEKSVEYTGITNKDRAAKLASRDLKTLSVPLAKMEIKVNRYGTRYNVGDVIRVSWAAYMIDDVVFRITQVNEGKFGGGDLTLHVVEDVFGTASEVYATANPDTAAIYHPPINTAYQHVEEAPYALLRNIFTDAEMVDVNTHNIGYVVGIMSAENSISYGCLLNAELSLTTYSSLPTPLSTSGTLVPSLTREAKEATLSLPANHTGYLGAIQIDNEYMEITGYTAQGYAQFKRGCYDTLPEPHSVGAPVWLLEECDYAIVDQPFNELETPYVAPLIETVNGYVVAGTSLSEAEYKALGKQYSEDSIIQTIAITGRARKPYPPVNVQLNGEYWPSDIGDGAFDVTWQPRNKVTQALTLIDWFEDSGTAEDGATYNIRFFDIKEDLLIEEATGLAVLTYSANPNAAHVRMELETVVSGITSRIFVHEFTRGVLASGYGYDYGSDYGGV